MSNDKYIFPLFLLLLFTAVPARSVPAQAAPLYSAPQYCPPLSPPPADAVLVADESSLRALTVSAPANTTLLLAAGTYHMQDFLHISVSGLTLRGAVGSRDAVVLDFGGMLAGYFGILVDADDVTIADLTIRNAHDHGVSIQGVDRPVLYNLHILDIGDQLVKVNPAGDGSQDGLLACSRLEYTTTAPDDYTNGISAHDAHHWTVRDNEWLRIRSPADITGPTILFWSGSSDTLVERNWLFNCYRGIAFGNPSHTGVDHTGGIVRNNMISFNQPHDVAIEMTHAQGWLVANNTALLRSPAPGLTWGMEARYSDSQGVFAYNLSNLEIWEDRDGAVGSVLGNLTTAQPGWFLDPDQGNLHVGQGVGAVIDQAALLPEVPEDYDGQLRPAGSAPDIGADEVQTEAIDRQAFLPLLRR